jgi:phage portal protein BeeE
MSESAITRALQRSALIAANVKAAGANPIVAGSGALGALGIGSAQQNHAREQGRHFCGWVYAAIRVIAQRIAGQPIRVARRTKSAPADPKARLKSLSHFRAAPPFVKSAANRLEPLDTHPLLTALECPNDLMSGFQLLYTVVCHLELSGQSFLWMRDADGGTLDTGLEIWPLPPSWVQPQHDRGPFSSYKVRPDFSGKEFEVPGDEIARVFYPDPNDPIFGAYSPLQAAALAVSTDESIQTAQHRHFLNGLMPGMAVIVGRQSDVDGSPGERPALNRDQRAQITTAIKQAYRGVYNAGEPIILDRLIEDVRRITNTAAEMDFLDSSRITKSRILQLFGVSPASMGDVDAPNRASSAAADDHLCKSTLAPKCALISAALTKWVAPRFGGDVVAYLEEPRATDPDSDRADREQLARYGAITVNELRAAAHLEPLDDGDELIAAGAGGITLTGATAGD